LFGYVIPTIFIGEKADTRLFTECKKSEQEWESSHIESQ